MTSKEYKDKWEKAKAEAATIKFKFNELKQAIKSMRLSEKIRAKKELKAIKTQLKEKEAEASYYRKQYILLAKSEGQSISAVSVAFDEIKKQFKKDKK